MIGTFLLAGVVFLTPTASQTAGDTGTVLLAKDVVRVLATGQLAEKQALLPQVTDMEMPRKSPAVAAAVAAELLRMNAIVRDREENLRHGRKAPSAPDIGEYYMNLLEACVSSKNPIVIPALVEGMNGLAVRNALVAFGPLAVEPVMTALERESEPMRLQGDAMTMAGLLRVNAVSPGQRARVVATWKARTRIALHPAAWRGFLELAVATGSADAAILRSMARRSLAAQQAQRQ